NSGRYIRSKYTQRHGNNADDNKIEKVRLNRRCRHVIILLRQWYDTISSLHPVKKHRYSYSQNQSEESDKKPLDKENIPYLLVFGTNHFKRPNIPDALQDHHQNSSDKAESSDDNHHAYDQRNRLFLQVDPRENVIIPRIQ